jgi:hypothetical protein
LNCQDHVHQIIVPCSNSGGQVPSPYHPPLDQIPGPALGY